MRSGITNFNENERRKHDEDRKRNIDERKPPYQITNDKPKHLRRLCNETRTPKPFLIRAAELLRQMDIDGRKLEKTPDHIKTPWYTDDKKNMDWSLCKMNKGTPNEIFCTKF
jgi:hypothetical protein